MKRAISYRREKSAAADDKQRLHFLQPCRLQSPSEGKKGSREASGELLERGPLPAQRRSAPAALLPASAGSPRWKAEAGSRDPANSCS